MADFNPGWHEITVEDKDALSGRSVHEFVKHVCDSLKIRKVIVTDIIGAAIDLSNGHRYTTESFLDAVKNAVQFDWAFFYLYSQEPADELNFLDEVRAMRDADATIRLVDDQFFYVYTDKPRLIEALKEKYEQAVVTAVDMSKVSVPY